MLNVEDENVLLKLWPSATLGRILEENIKEIATVRVHL